MWRRMQGKKQNPGQASYEVSHLPEGLGMVHKKTVSIKCLQDVLSLRTLLRSQQALRFWQIMYFWYMSFPRPLYMNIFKGKHPKRLNLHYSKFVVWHFSHTFIRFFSPAPLCLCKGLPQALVAIQSLLLSPHHVQKVLLGPEILQLKCLVLL